MWAHTLIAVPTSPWYNLVLTGSGTSHKMLDLLLGVRIRNCDRVSANSLVENKSVTEVCHI